MRIDKLSSNFTPLDEGIRFGIDTESDSATDICIEIIDVTTNEVVATKLLRDTTSTTVNIAPYIHAVGGYTPATAKKFAFRDVPTATYKVRVGEVESEEVTISVNRRNIGSEPAIVGDFPHLREISRNEIDEVLMIVPKGAPLYVEVITENDMQTYDHVAENEAVSFTIAPIELADEAQNFDVRIYVDDNEICSLHYSLTPQHKTSARLAWVADSGAIERYTFPLVSQKSSVAEKQSFMGSDGICSVRSSAKQILSLRSQFEPRATIEALAQVVYSPKVWLEQNGEWLSVEVATSQVEYNLFGEPNFLVLEVGLWQKEVALW